MDRIVHETVAKKDRVFVLCRGRRRKGSPLLALWSATDGTGDGPVSQDKIGPLAFPNMETAVKFWSDMNAGAAGFKPEEMTMSEIVKEAKKCHWQWLWTPRDEQDGRRRFVAAMIPS